MVLHYLELEAGRWRARNDCRQWIKTHLVKSRQKQNVRALKHIAESAGRGHLTHASFKQALSEACFRVSGEFVLASIS